MATEGMGASVTPFRLGHGNCRGPREWREADRQVWRQMWLLPCLIPKQCADFQGDCSDETS